MTKGGGKYKMLTLFSNNCPRCKVLKKKLDEKGIDYKENTNVDDMIARGITTVPMLEVDQTLLDFSGAIRWVNESGELYGN